MVYPLLSCIESPHDLRDLTRDQLNLLVSELRAFLIETLDHAGGHFGANLGVVELTVALHYVFNTPWDRLVWDVGHQSYAHKILTGRRKQLCTIRKTGGVAPFPVRAESPYDAFGVGHSSTAISAALGMAMATSRQKKARDCIAVIGDGGLTGGMAFEALNHAGAQQVDLLVILNDNKMSISENVGALTNYFARILSGKTYNTLRACSKHVFAKDSLARNWIKKTELHVKGMITAGTLFEELGLHYFGPVAGHDLDNLLPTLRNLRTLSGPRLLHVITEKGKGYAPAESSPIAYHAVKSGFTQTTSAPCPATQPAPLTYSEIFGKWLCQMAQQDDTLIAITPAMCEGSGMRAFAKAYPDRYIDVGIAEQHSLTLAAGMACEGLKPIVAIYSTFLQRAYDQLIHDIALQNLDVTLAIDRSGIVGGDGATHQGAFDLSYLRCIPNIVLMAPACATTCRDMLYTAYCYKGPAAVRYPRGNSIGKLQSPMQKLPIGKSKIKRQGKTVALLSFGSMLKVSLAAGEILGATVVDMRFIKPLDQAQIIALAKSHVLLATLEENVIAGGAGTAVHETLSHTGVHTPLIHFGLPDHFIAHGDPHALQTACGLGVKDIVHVIAERLASISRAAS